MHNAGVKTACWGNHENRRWLEGRREMQRLTRVRLDWDNGSTASIPSHKEAREDS